MPTLDRLRVFLSSPGDVLAERTAVRQVVERELQKERTFRDCKLEVVSWDDPDGPTPLDAYLPPQQALARQLPLPSQCDVVIVVLWSRMGTPLTYDGDSFLSGTHYEFMEAVRADHKPRVLLFHCIAPPQEAWRNINFHETPQQQQAQLANLQQFLASFKNDDGSLSGHFTVYRTLDEFMTNVRLSLRNVLLQRVEELRTAAGDLGIALTFRRSLKAFREEYLVSERQRVPFGGRDTELDFLDHWLEAASREPRLLITAPAGRGKSALVVRWIEQREARSSSRKDEWQIAFMPISIRAGTNLPERFYQGLALRLAEISGLLLDETKRPDTEYFKAGVRKQLDHIAKEGKKVLVVIDGVDEALEGSFDATIIPKLLPTTLRVLVSARTQVGDSEADSTGWLRRLGWDVDTRVMTMQLEKLDAERIADVLVGLGAPLDMLANDPKLVNRLAELTEGEPLLVRYYVADLWDRSLEGARITAPDLDTLKPGFASYFSRWLDNQETLWREEGAGIDRNEVDRVFVILAYALGRLSETDLLDLVREIHGVTALIFPDRLLKPLRRFVMGDGKPGSGFVLSHPKIGDYLRAERFRAAEKQVQRAFAKWGSNHLRALNVGEVQPADASHYLLLFLPRHLEIVRAPAADFMAMVEDGWRQAWEIWSGGQVGFANAIREAWRSCRRDGPIAHMGSQCRCALALSSIKSIGHNIPGALLVSLVTNGALAPPQARYYLELKGGTLETVSALAEIAVTRRDSPSRDSPSNVLEMVFAALDLAMTGGNDGERANLLECALKCLLSETLSLPIGDRPAALDGAVERSRSLESSAAKARVLTSIASHATGPVRAQLIKEALECAENITSGYGRVMAHSALIRLLAPNERRELTAQVLQECIAFLDGGLCSQALTSLVPHLDYEQLKVALDAAISVVDHPQALLALAPHLDPGQRCEALQAAMGIKSDSSRGRSLGVLVPYFDEEGISAVVTEVMRIASAIRSPTDRLRIIIPIITLVDEGTKEQALSDCFWQFGAIGERLLSTNYQFFLFDLASNLNFTQMNLALSKAFEVVDPYCRANALGALAPFLEADQRKRAVVEALNAVDKIDSAGDRSDALVTLSHLLDMTELHRALHAAMAIGDGNHRSRALTALTPFLSSAQRDEALHSAMAIGDVAAQSRTLAALAPYLEAREREKALTEALTAAEACGDDEARFRALTAMSAQLGEDQRRYALAAARRAALSLTDEWRRADALTILTSLVEMSERVDLLREAKALADPNTRARTLAKMAQYLDQSSQASALSDAVQSVASVGNEQQVAQGLEGLASALDPVHLAQALEVAGAIGDECQRSKALSHLARYLSPDKQGEALRAAVTIANECCRSNALEALVPHLQSEQLREVLQAASVIENDVFRTRPLKALAPYLKPDQLLDAVKTALALGDDNLRSTALAQLAPCVESSRLGEGLQIAAQINSPYDRAKALAALAPVLAPCQHNQALQMASEFEEESCRADALAALAPVLDPGQRGRILQMALRIGDMRVRVQVLSALAPLLDADQRGQALVSALHAVNDGKVGTEALGKLVPLLDAEQRSQVLSDALSTAVSDEQTGCEALAILVPFLDPDQRSRVIRAAVQIAEPWSRTHLLEALAPHLGPEQHVQALQAASAIGNEEFQSEAVTTLAKHIAYPASASQVSALLEAASRLRREDALGVAKQSVELSGNVDTAVISELHNAIRDVCRWYP